jgi:hypothetical protein
MSIAFTKTTNYEHKDPCAICHEPLGNGQEVAMHDDDLGRKHPMHNDCINRWINTNPTCPFCSSDVQVQEKPLTLKDRAIRAIPELEHLNLTSITISTAAIGAAAIGAVAVGGIESIRIIALGLTGIVGAAAIGAASAYFGT